MEQKTPVYFSPGDLVCLKHDLENAPVMLVSEVKKARMRADTTGRGQLLGITCIWFTNSGQLQEFTFSTKDLVSFTPVK
jgi:uncharacterized protein YodC (DUF2158 family)